LKTNPLGASHATSRALTCSACSREWHRAIRSSAYAASVVMPRALPYANPAADGGVLLSA
jgi:hypothetical protein